VSIGLATWEGPEDSLENLLARADQALYRAKAEGRDRVVG
jgi:diguanylate cyclase (GGDEF)-like protein